MTRALLGDLELLRAENEALTRQRDEAQAMLAAASATLGRRPGSPPLDFRLERDTRRAIVGGEPVPLSRRECDLLAHLLDQAGRTLSAADLLAAVWPEPGSADGRAVRVHVSLLRSKLERRGRLPFRITTLYGEGYRLERNGAGPSAV
jgi:DNA-binding response OmpR family regulator